MIWIFNFDAEFELARKNYTTPAALLADLQRHGAAAKSALMAPGDRELSEPTGERNDGAALGRAWCPTPRAIAKLRDAGVVPEPHPDVAVLRRVNHRLFAHELGGGLPGQRYVTAFPDLRGGPWLLKRPLTCAGRGQLRVSGSVDAKQRAWIEKSLQHDGLIVEPLVQPTLEVSLHGYIANGDYRLGRTCLHARGLAEEHPELRKQGRRVAQALIAAGYFGPFGIDGYHHAGGFCALSEINARYTMAYALGMG